MSGAAGIAAAKNRRSKPDPNQKQLPPPISCGSKNGACPPQSKPVTTQNKSNNVLPTNKVLNSNNIVDPESLQILGPMPPVQILRLHEQRLNKFDEKINMILYDNNNVSNNNVSNNNVSNNNISINEELIERIHFMENKIMMLEEVIMTLQNKLTIAQNFAMETNLNMSRLINSSQLQPSNTLTSTTPLPIINENIIIKVHDEAQDDSHVNAQDEVIINESNQLSEPIMITAEES
jgi:hypothetical protein